MQLLSFLVLGSQARIVDFHYVWEVKECLSLQPSSLLMETFFFFMNQCRKGIRVLKNLLPLSAVIPLPQSFYKNVSKTKALVNKVQRKSVELVKPTGGVQAIGKDADLVHTIFCLILQLYGITHQSGCCMKGMAFMRRLCSIFVVNQQLV